MKKFLAMLCALVIVFTMAACGEDTPASSPLDSSGGGGLNAGEAAYNIWVCDKSAVHQYHRTLKLGCEAAAADLNVNLTCDAPAVSGDAAAQLDMFATAVAAKPDAICIGAIDQEAVVATMEQAKEAGIPVFCYDNGVNSDIPITTLATNDIAATRTLAEKIGAGCGGEGGVLVIGHDQTSKMV